MLLQHEVRINMYLCTPITGATLRNPGSAIVLIALLLAEYRS